MQLRILALAAVLIGAVSVPPASAQNQGKRDLKAQQKVEEEAEKRQELLAPEEVQPMAGGSGPLSELAPSRTKAPRRW